MAHGEIVADSGTVSENGEELALALPAFLPSDPASGNFKILDVIGRGFDRLDDDIRDVDEASNVQTANSVAEIAELAKPVETRPRVGEQKEKYRTRVIARFQQVAGEGTINGLILNVATLLSVPAADVEYDPYEIESGAVLVRIPKSSLDALGLSENAFVTIVNDQLAAGYRVEAQFSGTFLYRSEADYNNGVNDPAAGYGGLDANGDPDGTGGTYAGIIGN